MPADWHSIRTAWRADRAWPALPPPHRAIWPAWRAPVLWRPRSSATRRVVLTAAAVLMLAAALAGACLLVAAVGARIP